MKSELWSLGWDPWFLLCAFACLWPGFFSLRTLARNRVVLFCCRSYKHCRIPRFGFHVSLAALDLQPLWILLALIWQIAWLQFQLFVNELCGEGFTVASERAGAVHCAEETLFVCSLYLTCHQANAHTITVAALYVAPDPTVSVPFFCWSLHTSSSLLF